MPQQTAGSATQTLDPDAALHAIAQRRSELNSQLVSLTVRRDLLTQQIRNSDATGQAQLRAQITEVGNQTARVLKDMAATDAAANKLTADLSAASGQVTGTTSTTVPPPLPAADELAERIAVIGGGALFFVLLVAFARWLWRPRSSSATQLGQADVSRIERLQQSIDVIAVEVERVAESQRHLTKVLADRALGAGGAEEIAVRDRQADKAKR